jgi:hypothetical protein
VFVCVFLVSTLPTPTNYADTRRLRNANNALTNRHQSPRADTFNRSAGVGPESRRPSSDDADSAADDGDNILAAIKAKCSEKKSKAGRKKCEEQAIQQQQQQQQQAERKGKGRGERGGGDGRRAHPSSRWYKSRGSSRFHFAADRLGDVTSFAQVPMLDAFLRDVENTVNEGNGKLKRAYHEMYDVTDA